MALSIENFGNDFNDMIYQLFRLAAFSILLTCSFLANGEEALPLPVLEVYSKSIEDFRLTPGSTHLESGDLQRSGQRELSQVLRALPGISTFQGAIGAGGGISLRGASGSVGLVNIDGIPIHDTLPGLTSLELFPAETFGSADILRGSAAMLDFGRSLGGTINLHSRDKREIGGGLHLEGGSFGSLRESATVDLVQGMHSVNLTAGRDDLFDGTPLADARQGNSERDDFHAHQLAMHVRNAFSDSLQLDSSVYYVNSESGIDKIGLISPAPEFAVVDDPGRADQEIWLAQSTAGIDLLPKWHSSLQLGFTEHRVNALLGSPMPNSKAYPIAFENQLALVRWKNSHQIWLNNQQKRGLQFNWGAEGIYERGLSTRVQPGANPIGFAPIPRDVTIGEGGHRDTGSGFANLQADWDDWQGTLAVRLDHFNDYDTHAVFHAGLSWQMAKQWQWFASGGTGYRPPSFNEMLMWPFANNHLKPEQSVGGEFGVRWQPDGDTQLSVNYFHSQYKDLIKVERSAVPLGLILLNNFPNARVQGIESQWSSQWNTQLTTGIDYTWTDSEDTDTGAPLPRQPKHVARFWGEWAWKNLPLKLWTQGIYRGNSFDTGGTAELSDGFNLDMQLSYQIVTPLNLYVRGENLTDNRQSQFIGWGISGAAVYGGFKYVFQ